MLRNSVIRGPAAAWYCLPANIATTPVYYTEDDIVAPIDLESTPLNTNAFGKVDDSAKNIKIDVGFTPTGIWKGGGAAGVDFLARTVQLWPYFATLPGTSIYAATKAAEKHLYIKSMTGGAGADVYDFGAAAITGMPDLNFSTQKIMAGKVTFGCIRELAADNTIQPWNVASDSLVTQTAAAFAPETVQRFSTADVLRDHYTALWTGVTGMTAATETLDGFKISFGMEIKPEECDGLGIYDYTFKGMTVSLKFTPIGGPTVAQLLTAMKIQGAAAIQRGSSLAAIHGATLILSGSQAGRPMFTLNGAALTNFPMQFGPDVKRIGELSFSGNRTWVADSTGAICALGVVAA